MSSAGEHAPLVDVCLVNMPYAAIERPSLALGLLSSALKRDGIRTKCLYPCLQFAERIGLAAYEAVNISPTDLMIGEWTFSSAAFPDYRAEGMHAYARAAARVLEAEVRSQTYLPRKNLLRLIHDIRAATTAFVDDMAREVVALRPRIVGCTSTFQQHCASLALLRRVREFDPSIVTLLGGANCEGPMGEAARRKFQWLDFVVSGEADDIIVRLCRLLLASGRDVAEEELPDGVIGPSARLHKTPAPPRAAVWSLDHLPTPDFDDYFDQLGRSGIAPYIRPGLVAETSRGCWWGMKSHCTFCGLNGTAMRYRSKSGPRVLEELEELSQRYSLRAVEIVDNIIDMQYFESVLPHLSRRDPPLSLFYETKANLKRRHVEMFAAAGVHYIQPGLESMQDDILKLLGKGNTSWMNVQLLKWAREEGIHVTWIMLMFVPGERDEWYAEMHRWLPLIAHLQPPDSMTAIQYHRFSPYHANPEKWGLKLLPAKCYSYVYPLAEDELRDFAYFFDNAAMERRPEYLRRPSLQAMAAWITEWRRVFWLVDPPPVLSMKDDGATIAIHDTRSCRTMDHHELTGMAAEVYRACDSALPLAAIATEIGVDAEAVQATLDDLVRRKLTLELQGRYLSLATHAEPSMSVPLFPGGHADIARYSRERMAM